MKNLIHGVQSLAAALMLGGSLAATAGPVNINTADASTIAEELTGIGQAKAEAIVRFREEHGPFTDLAQLAAVKGIGVKLLERNHQNVLLED